MYPVTSKFLSAVRQSHEITFRAEVRSNGYKVLDLYPNSGSVNIDGGNTFRRTMNLTIADSTQQEILLNSVYQNYSYYNTTYSTYSALNSALSSYSKLLVVISYTQSVSFNSPYVPKNAYSALTPYGNEIWIWRGVKYPDNTIEEVPLGVFVITSVEIDDSGSGVTIKVSGVDRAIKLMRNKPTDSAYSSGYSTISSLGVTTIGLNVALTALLQTFYPSIELNLTPVYLLINSFVLQIGDDPWAKAVEIANSVGYDLYFDAEGVCTLDVFPDVSGAVADIEYLENNEAVLLNVNRKISSDSTYNGVHVTATGTNMLEPFIATAWDEDSSSPTYRYGGFGQVPVFISSNQITGQAVANNTAQRLLSRYIGSAEEISWTSIVNPAMDVYDVVQLVNTGTAINTTLIVDNLTIPFGASETMSAKARAIRFLPVS